MRSQAIRIEAVPLSEFRCEHVWVEDSEKCLTGFTAEPYPVIDEWEQPLCCEKCGDTALRWVGFELHRG